MTLLKRLGRLFGTEAAPAKPLTPKEAFAQLYTAEALAHPDVERVETNREVAFSLLLWPKGETKPWTIYLDNLFRESREFSPEEKQAQIRRALSTLEHRDDELSWSEATEVLVPLVRVATFGIEARMAVLSRPFLPFVREFVGLDQGATFSYVNREEAERWQRADAEIFDAADAVLKNHIADSDVEVYDREASYPILHVTRDDSYESSRLALPGFLASFRGKVVGNPIAIIPARSTLVISGDGNPDAVARLARSAESEFSASARSISPAVYTVDAGDAVVPLHLPAEHPHHHLVESGHRRLSTCCYAEQKTVLERRNEQDGIDVFVATLGTFSKKDSGETRTWATMTEGVRTLLPEADYLALGERREDGWKGIVPWAKVFELAPECFERIPEYDPPRWRTVGWPAAEVIAQLRQLEL